MALSWLSFYGFVMGVWFGLCHGCPVWTVMGGLDFVVTLLRLSGLDFVKAVWFVLCHGFLVWALSWLSVLNFVMAVCFELCHGCLVCTLSWLSGLYLVKAVWFPMLCLYSVCGGGLFRLRQNGLVEPWFLQ